MDADYYLETIKTVFQDYSLVHGTWNVKNLQGKNELVRPQDITTTAMLTVEGELDDISGSGQTAAAHGLCSNIKPANRLHLEVPGAGHYGIFSGRRWRETVYPAVVKFILAHNDLGNQKKAATKTNAKTAVKTATKPVAKVAAKVATKAAAKPTAKRAVKTVAKKAPSRKK
jgi:poly(3-hydroxybutyrate) depolymerase